MNRALAVTRMHLTDRLTLFGLPPAILAASFLVNMLIFAVEPEHSRHSGGAAAIYIVLLVVGVLGTARGLGFTLSMGASRRAFALGTGLTGGLLAAAFGVLMLVLNRIEDASGGWGLHAHFFTFGWLGRQNPAAAWLLATVGFLALFLLGGWLSTIWLRWNTAGLTVATVAAVLVFGGLAVLVTWRGWWHGVGHWFVQLTPLSASGWVALLSAALGGAAYLTLRRTAI